MDEYNEEVLMGHVESIDKHLDKILKVLSTPHPDTIKKIEKHIVLIKIKNLIDDCYLHNNSNSDRIVQEIGSLVYNLDPEYFKE